MNKRARRKARWVRKQHTMWYWLRVIWMNHLKIGDVVQDCAYREQPIKEMDGESVILENGASCSLLHCCDPVPVPRTLKDMITFVEKLEGEKILRFTLHGDYFADPEEIPE